MTTTNIPPATDITFVTSQCGRYKNHQGSCDTTVVFHSLHTEDQCEKGIKTLAHDDQVAILGMDSNIPINAVVTTLSGYGLKNRSYEGPDGMARYLEALKRNEKHGGAWISVSAVVISAYREVPKPRTTVHVGELIRISSAGPGEGGIYRIEFFSRWDHHNVQLVRA